MNIRKYAMLNAAAVLLCGAYRRAEDDPGASVKWEDIDWAHRICKRAMELPDTPERPPLSAIWAHAVCDVCGEPLNATFIGGAAYCSDLCGAIGTSIENALEQGE